MARTTREPRRARRQGPAHRRQRLPRHAARDRGARQAPRNERSYAPPPIAAGGLHAAKGHRTSDGGNRVRALAKTGHDHPRGRLSFGVLGAERVSPRVQALDGDDAYAVAPIDRALTTSVNSLAGCGHGTLHLATYPLERTEDGHASMVAARRLSRVVLASRLRLGLTLRKVERRCPRWRAPSRRRRYA